MKAAFQILAILIISFVFELFLPWWSIAVAGFIVGCSIRARFSFLNGFMAIVVLWLSRILIFKHSAATPLIEKVARIFTLPSHNVLIVITILIGGIVGGMGTLTGSLLRKDTNNHNK